jgi:hypothetical protein
LAKGDFSGAFDEIKNYASQIATTTGAVNLLSSKPGSNGELLNQAVQQRYNATKESNVDRMLRMPQDAARAAQLGKTAGESTERTLKDPVMQFTQGVTLSFPGITDVQETTQFEKVWQKVLGLHSTNNPEIE